MDFLSLFDPNEGMQGQPKKNTKHKSGQEQDNVKKKPDGVIKGRRRGRRSNGKNETLPEESSFLNEPDLSTEVMVKDVSYIDSYIEINSQCDGTKPEDKKPKKRSGGRKSRRRKKISPAKDLSFEKIYTSKNNLNNTVMPKIENVGKNVNDLTADYKARYRIESEPTDGAEFKDRAVYNVIDKLERVSLKDDMYLAGDLTAQDLESDCFYCSDDEEELDGDTSDGSESSGSVTRSLPPEPRFGNVEYKLRLSAHTERRFQHLVTQLKWRLVSGGGSCVYVIGVRDCGALVGLSARALRASLRALRRMAAALHAHIAHLTARRVHTHRAVAEVYIKKLAHPQQSIELRVAVMGANEAGKSTLIGVLTQGELDNGNGSARLNMFRHQHEVKTGMTSSLSHEILGFDAQGNVVNYGCSELMTAERIGERSAKLVSFLDLAGHSKYQRTTRHGITGYSPHAAMLVISATAGITPITEEHMGILLALRLPFFIVINKCELARTNVRPLMGRLVNMLRNHDKKPLLITDESLARNCCGPQKLILDSIEPGQETMDGQSCEQVAVFPVSCVRGFGLNALHAHLLALEPPSLHHLPPPEEETVEFQIDEIFHVGDSGDPVVGGLLTRGRLYERDRLLIGPLDDGSFKLVGVRSIYRNRVPSGTARAGQPASLGLQQPCPPVRPGMVLLSVPAGYRRSRRCAWPPCEGDCTRKQEISDLIRSKQSPIPTRSLRKKNKNLLQDLAHAEEVLTKDIENNQCNLYLSDSEQTDRQEEIKYVADGNSSAELEAPCACADRVILEDPNDPRGCLFFQATVSVIRHSTAIHPGFQCTVHVGNVRQTAIIEGIMSRGNVVRAGESASALFRFVRTCEYLAKGRQLLFTQGLGTRGVGRITQIFPYVP